MSVHSSLRSRGKGRQHRSVLKRFERIRKLAAEDKWNEDKHSVFGLPKVRMIKVVVKKQKAEKKPEQEAAAVQAPEDSTKAAVAEKKPKKGKEKE